MGWGLKKLKLDVFVLKKDLPSLEHLSMTIKSFDYEKSMTKNLPIKSFHSILETNSLG